MNKHIIFTVIYYIFTVHIIRQVKQLEDDFEEF